MNAPAAIFISPRRKDCFATLGHKERRSGLLTAPPYQRNRTVAVSATGVGKQSYSPFPTPME